MPLGRVIRELSKLPRLDFLKPIPP